MRFVGNLTTWREILTSDIEKYIRNGGKCNYIPGKNVFFSDPGASVLNSAVPALTSVLHCLHISPHKTSLLDQNLLF